MPSTETRHGGRPVANLDLGTFDEDADDGVGRFAHGALGYRLRTVLGKRPGGET